MLPNECEKMSDEWWVMNDKNWMKKIEWPFFVGQAGYEWSKKWSQTALSFLSDVTKESNIPPHGIQFQ